ncbi:MAG: putative Nascent polypeptide associated complex alpha [Streblomastix strix]|uniref:Putative Nascent polypeptide associated complex alpha n=1 Tax=Streblomastix strix TaxID=222440 RepID=A0A5J4VMA0_9EUKA|nr:MAG: putative Nascent polypeptide associated complex alpha [Streblomastix strix]
MADSIPDLEPVEPEPAAAAHTHIHDHEHPHDHDHDHAHDHDEDAQQDGHSKQSKAEKKARKAAKNLGFKAAPEIVSLTAKQQKNPVFTINKPDVLKSANDETFIIFGGLQMDDISTRAQQQAAEQFKAADIGKQFDHTQIPDLDAETAKEETKGKKEVKVKPEETDEVVDMTGLSEDDVKVVMEQAKVTKKQAAQALRDADNDYIQAILQLSK